MSLHLTFIHGWASSPLIWQPLLSKLDRRFILQQVALPWVDRPTVSASLQPLDQYIQTLAGKLHQSDIIVGWSLGGWVATAYAARYPERFRQMVLISAPLQFVSQDPRDFACDADEFSVFQAGFHQSPGKTLNRFIALQARRDDHEQDCRTILHSALNYVPQMYESLCDGLHLLHNSDLRKSLQELRQRVTLLHGEHDQVISWRASESLYRQGRADAFHLLPGCGHVPHVSRPEAVANVIHALAERQESRP